eukprot:7070183-Pyramimonas_sp.AAC.1
MDIRASVSVTCLGPSAWIYLAPDLALSRYYSFALVERHLAAPTRDQWTAKAQRARRRPFVNAARPRVETWSYRANEGGKVARAQGRVQARGAGGAGDFPALRAASGGVFDGLQPAT